MSHWHPSRTGYAAIVLATVIGVAVVSAHERSSSGRVRFSTSPGGELLATVHRRGDEFSIHLSGIASPRYDTPRVERPEIEVAHARPEPRLFWKGETELQIVGPNVEVLITRMKVGKRTIAIQGGSVRPIGKDGPRER